MASASTPSLMSKMGQLLKKSGPSRGQLLATPDAPKLVIPLGRQWTSNELRVQQDESNLRLDRLITSRYDISKSLLQKLLRKQMVRLERPDYASAPGVTADEQQIVRIPASGSVRVQAGDVISMSRVFLRDRRKPPMIRLEDMGPEKQAELHSLVLYKDDALIVLNKPSGLSVHGGPGVDEHLERFLEAFKFGEQEAPRLVHRLDRDTSGVMLLARTRQAASSLAARFQEASLSQSVEKTVCLT